MSKKNNIIKEDVENIYNKWVSGIAKKEAPPEVITVADLQNRYRNSLNYEAPKQLPYPLTNFIDYIGNLFVKSAELRRLLGDAVKYPIIKEDAEKVAALKTINNKLNNIQEIIYSCADDLNKLLNKKNTAI